MDSIPENSIVHYSDMTYTPVKWWKSLFARIFAIFITITLSLMVLVGVLTILVHRTALKPLISAASLDAVQEQVVTGLAVTALLAVVLTALSAFILSRYLTNPIRQLTEAMRQVSHDNIAVRLRVYSADELGQLAEFFNGMMQTLAQVRARNQAMQKLKSQFVSEAAHQLRTPLTGLKWSIEYLLKDDDQNLTAVQRETLAKGFAATEHMMELVNEFLNVSKFEEGKFGLNLQAVAIVVVCKKIAGEYAEKAAQRNIRFRFMTKVDNELKIVGDPEHLQLALVNLLENALAYTPAGGSVTVTLAATREYLIISVADTGIGIPRADQSLIFSKFYRASNAKKFQTQGSGMGLFIAKNIAQRHGGKLTLQSEEGKGTTFEFMLPLREELIPRAESLTDVLQEL